MLRQIAGALADPARGPKMRALLQSHCASHAGKDLKTLLASAPLDLELDFDRTHDTAREIEF